MKKSFKLYIICWAIMLALFNAVCFITPNEAAGLSKFGGAFFVGYIFITVAFVGQLVCAYIAFKAEDLEKLFYNLPLITVSYSGLILTLLLGGAAMVIPNLPNWVGAVACLFILGLYAVAVIKAIAAAKAVASVDKKISRQTGFIKNLTLAADHLVSHAQSEEVQRACKKVLEAVRYSDPMSSIRLQEIEERITTEMQQLRETVENNDAEIASTVAEELIALLEDRNRQCKAFK